MLRTSDMKLRGKRTPSSTGKMAVSFSCSATQFSSSSMYSQAHRRVGRLYTTSSRHRYSARPAVIIGQLEGVQKSAQVPQISVAALKMCNADTQTSSEHAQEQVRGEWEALVRGVRGGCCSADC